MSTAASTRHPVNAMNLDYHGTTVGGALDRSTAPPTRAWLTFEFVDTLVVIPDTTGSTAAKDSSKSCPNIVRAGA